jgi:hypothetical protein
MQNVLIKNNKKIKLYSAYVFKQGQSGNKTISKRLMIMNQNELMWYHDEEEYLNGRTPLGVIYIEHIYQCGESLM